MPSPATTRATTWRAHVIAFILVATAGGCGGLSDIDRRVDRLVDTESARLGGDAPSPRLRDRPADSYDRKGQTDKKPPTRNPSASQITYRGADAARDVLGRLDAYAEVPDNARPLDLEGVFAQVPLSAREYLSAEEEYLLAAIRVLVERHLWGPRFFNDVTATIGADAFSGRYSTALNVINTLRATQRLPYGGEVEARLITSTANQLTEIVGDKYVQSSALVIGANVPLLRGAGLIAQEDLIQSERDLVYAARTFEQFRRDFLVSIATDYFNLLAQRAQIRNQEERLRSVMKFYEQTQALVEAGRERPFQARNVEQNVLTSRDALISSRENYILALDRFKVRLGVPVETPIALVPMTLDLEDPEVGVTEAAQAALDYRLDYQTQADRIDDARRQVANARNGLLPDLNATASATLNTDDDNRVSGVFFDGDETDYNASLTLGLPLDREIERLNLRSSIIQLNQQIREFEQFRDNLVLEARQAVREVDRARFSLRLQDQAVQINELRLEELRIKADEVDAQTRLDAENELLQSRNDRDSARRDLRISILEYLRATGQLRVSPDGQFKPLDQMRVQLERVAEPAPAATAPPGDTSAPADPAEATPPPPERPVGSDVPPDAPIPGEPQPAAPEAAAPQPGEPQPGAAPPASPDAPRPNP